LAFRDFLHEHSNIATEYVALKKRLARLTDAADMSSREVYARAKSEFIERVVRTALAAGYPRDFDRLWREIASDNVVIAPGKILDPTLRLGSI
jgi:GrpB protein